MIVVNNGSIGKWTEFSNKIDFLNSDTHRIIVFTIIQRSLEESLWTFGPPQGGKFKGLSRKLPRSYGNVGSTLDIVGD